MEALTSSCSKSFVDRLGSSSPRGASAFHFSDRLEFCDSLRSQNDKVGSFRFLQMVHNKGISPVHAVPVPSDTQTDLTTVEPQAQKTEKTKVVRIRFQLQKHCIFGEHFLIVGDDPIIGAWDPSNALPMTWSEGHLWSTEMDVPAGKTIQFKFILKGKGGNIIWQPGSDRIVKTWETINRITVCEDWENASLQKIIEEEESHQSNGKPQIESKMSNFSGNLDHPEEKIKSDTAKAHDLKDSKTYPEEKPLAEPDLQQVISDSTSSSIEKPMAIVAENIDSSDNVVKSTTRRRGNNNMALQSETVVYDLGHIGKVAPVTKQTEEVVKDNLFDFEGGPVLVPDLDLTPQAVSAQETAKGEVEERTTMDTSIGEVEAKDQNMPEFNEEQESDDGTPQEVTETLSDETKNIQFNQESDDGTPQEITETLSDETENIQFNQEQESDDGTPQEITETLSDETENIQFNQKQESDDGTPQEINETLSDEPEVVDNDYEEKIHLSRAMDEMTDSNTVHENILQNDVQWGRGLWKKFLSKLGLV